MLEAGIKGTKEIMVTNENTAKTMGSGTLDVFATPAMIALMENTAYESVAAELEEGSGTVGTALNVKHVAATPVGMKVTCETELIALIRSKAAIEAGGVLYGKTAKDKMGPAHKILTYSFWFYNKAGTIMRKRKRMLNGKIENPVDPIDPIELKYM